MTTDPIQLLRSLTLAAPSLAKAAPKNCEGGVDFAELLRQAQSGELSTKTPVTIDPDVNVELSDNDLAKLSFAADKAEAAGLRTALVLAGGKRLVLDVQQRRITGEAPSDNGVVSGVDGVIDLSASTPETARGIFGPLVLPSAEASASTAKPTLNPRADNASLLNLLSQLRKAQ